MLTNPLTQCSLNLDENMPFDEIYYFFFLKCNIFNFEKYLLIYPLKIYLPLWARFRVSRESKDWSAPNHCYFSVVCASLLYWIVLWQHPTIPRVNSSSSVTTWECHFRMQNLPPRQAINAFTAIYGSSYIPRDYRESRGVINRRL